MKNLIAFFQIPALNFDRAVSFYESVFNITLTVSGSEKEKMGFFTQEERYVGAISFTPDLTPSSNGILIYFDCNDIDATLSTIKNNGGAIMKDKQAIAGGRGYFAVFLDSEGNSIGLYSAK